MQNNNNTENKVVAVKDIGQKAITNMLNQVNNFYALEGGKLTKEETKYAVSIINSINKQIVNSKGTQNPYDWQNLDVIGCGLPQQIKRYARLGLSPEESEVWCEVRNNKNKNDLKDINIKMQYQGLEKLLIRYCSKKIIRFKKDVICRGDTFETEEDLKLGLTVISKHKKYEDEKDVYYRSKLQNITKAYAIAYVEERGELVPYCCVIDKERIEKARNSATTKTVWDSNTRKMVIKTAVWELYTLLKPYIDIPKDLKEDFEQALKDDYDLRDKDYINADVQDVNEDVSGSVATEKIENPFAKQEQEKTPEQIQDEIFSKHFDSGKIETEESFESILNNDRNY